MLVTPRKLEANRRNAARSTGPRTPEGKANSSQNSTTHGALCSHDVVHSAGETEQEHSAFRQRYFDHYHPQDPEQEACVEEIVSALWRLSRLRKVEAGHLDTTCMEIYNATLIKDAAGVPINPIFGPGMRPTAVTTVSSAPPTRSPAPPTT